MNTPESPLAHIETKDSNNTTKRKLRRGLAAAAGLAAGAALATGGVHVASKMSEGKPESSPAAEAIGLSTEQQAARDDLKATFETLTTEDVAEFSVDQLRVGPRVQYQGRQEPSILVDVTVAPGELRHSEWVRDGGTTVDGAYGEIQWRTLALLPEYTISPGQRDEQTMPGYSRVSDENGAFEGDAMGDGLMDQIDSAKENTFTLAIPMNTSITGLRQVELVPYLTGVRTNGVLGMSVDTETSANPHITDERGGMFGPSLEGEPVATFTVDVRADGITLVESGDTSAEKAE